jgi:hypothetical protein
MALSHFTDLPKGPARRRKEVEFEPKTIKKGLLCLVKALTVF